MVPGTLVRKGLERVDNTPSVHMVNGPTYCEKGSGTIANGITTTYLPTKLKTLEFIGLVGKNAYAKVALFTTVVGWTTDMSTVVRANTAQAGTAASITLDASASATNDIYNNLEIDITDSSGDVTTALISDYNGTTKVASLTNLDGSAIALSEVPTSTTPFSIRGVAITHTDPGNSTGATIAWKLEGKLT